MHADGARLGEPFDATDEGEGASRCTFQGSDLERSRIQCADGAAEPDRGDHVSAGRVKADVVRLVLRVFVDKLHRIVGEFKHAIYYQTTSRGAVHTLVGNCCMPLSCHGDERQQHRYERDGFPHISPAFEHVYLSRRHSQHILPTYCRAIIESLR